MSHDTTSRLCRRSYPNRCDSGATWQFPDHSYIERRKYRSRIDPHEKLKYIVQEPPQKSESYYDIDIPRWTLVEHKSDKSSSPSPELSTKSPHSSQSTTFGLDQEKFSEGKCDIISGESAVKLLSGSDASDLDTTRTYTLTKYPKIIDIQSILIQNMEDVKREQESEAIRLWNESWKKSKLLLDTLQSQRMNSRRSVDFRRTKRKRCKLGQETCDKVRTLETSEELRKVLDEFRMVDIKDIKRLYANTHPQKKLVPAYFVLKVSQESIADLQRKEGDLKKFTFINSNDEKPQIAGDSPEFQAEMYMKAPVQVKERTLQTCNVQEALVPCLPCKKQVGSPGLTSSNSCGFCEKTQDDLKNQKEFNMGLLDQMKDITQQLMTMTNLLKEVVMNKKETLMDPVAKSSGEVSEMKYCGPAVPDRKNDTGHLTDFSVQCQTEEVEERLKVAENEYREKASHTNDRTHYLLEQTTSTSTSDIMKLQNLEELPYNLEYRYSTKKSKGRNGRKKRMGFWKMCCTRAEDCDVEPKNEDYINEYAGESMSEKVVKAEENENISRDFRRHDISSWERRCNVVATNEEWSNYVHGKETIHKSWSSHSNLNKHGQEAKI